MSRARVGKIARLPASVREEINRRIYDGQKGNQITSWLKAHKHADDISDSNLTQWRQGGYQDWLANEAQVERTRQRAELALRLAKAAGGSVSQSILARIAGSLDEKLDNLSDEDVEKIRPLLDTLNEAEKMRLKAIEVDQKGELLTITRQKFQRDTVTLFQKWFADQIAREIAERPDTAADDRTEALGRHLFGEDWK